MNFKQNIKLFFGITFMLIFASSAIAISRGIIDSLFFQTFKVNWIVQFKLIQVIVTILLGIGAYFLTRKGKIKRVFHLFFSINILLFLVIYALFLFKVISLYSIGAAEASILKKIFISIFYLWVGFANAFLVVLIWGFANQHYSFKRASYQYPLIALIATTTFWVYLKYSMKFILVIQIYSLPLPLSVAIFYGIVYVIYIMLVKVDLSKKDILKKPSWKYLAALIAIVFFIALAKHFPQIAFKNFLRQKTPQPQDYLQIMGDFSYKQVIYSIFAFLLGVLLGIWIYIKGSKILAKIGGVLIIVITILGLYFFKVTTTLSLLDIKSTYSLLPYGLFVSFVTLFLYLIKELCYFRFPMQNRFSAKILVDLIFVSLAVPIYLNLTSSILAMKKVAVLASNNILMVSFFISMLICFMALYWINKDLKKA